MGRLGGQPMAVVPQWGRVNDAWKSSRPKNLSVNSWEPFVTEAETYEKPLKTKKKQ